MIGINQGFQSAKGDMPNC